MYYGKATILLERKMSKISTLAQAAKQPLNQVTFISGINRLSFGKMILIFLFLSYNTYWYPLKYPEIHTLNMNLGAVAEVMYLP